MATTRIIFITGTGTGAGKTVMTSLLLAHLREEGISALALTPVCSGGREDAEILHRLQRNHMTLNEVNPFHFVAPITPLAAARAERRVVPIFSVMEKIREAAMRCDWLLIEGAGGLLSPLGETVPERAAGRGRVAGARSKISRQLTYSAVDLIKRLRGQVLVCSTNSLGTINYTLMTLHLLRMIGAEPCAIVLRPPVLEDASAGSNPELLGEFCFPVPVFSLRAAE